MATRWWVYVPWSYIADRAAQQSTNSSWWNNTVTATWGNTAQNAWNSMTPSQQNNWSAANPGVNPNTAQVVNQYNASTGTRGAIWGWGFVNNQAQYTQNPEPIPQNPTTQTANTPTTAQNIGTTAATATDTSYQWGSVYDYLTQSGQDASFWARKKLADKYWIGGYRGTAQQNQNLLGQLRGAWWQSVQGTTTPAIQVNPQWAMKDQKFGAEAAKLGNQYQGLRNTTIATNLKGVAVDAIKQWVINNDWDLQNIVIQYLQNAWQTADITDPNRENTVDSIASKIKETPDYQVAISNKFSVDQFQNMDTDWLYGAMDNGILLPWTDVWKQLQESNKAGDMSAAKAKLNLKIQQWVANYIMDFRNTDPNSSVSSQATSMDDLGVVTDEAAWGTDNPLSALMAKFGLTAATKSTSLSMDPDVKSLIDQKTKLNGEIKSTKTVIDNLKTDLQAQITAWGGVATEWYLEALAAEKGKPLIAKYQALVDQYNGVQGALSDTLQFKQFDQQAKTQEFNQNMSMLNFAMDYQKTQLWQSNWEKEFALKSKTSWESWKPDTNNPWSYYRTNAQGNLEFTTQPWSDVQSEWYQWPAYTPIDSNKLNWAVKYLLTDWVNKSLQTNKECGRWVNDFYKSMWVSTDAIFTDPINAKTAATNSQTAKVGSAVVFDRSNQSWATEDQKKYGHVAIVTAVDSKWNPTAIADWNSDGEWTYSSRALPANWKWAIKGYFDPTISVTQSQSTSQQFTPAEINIFNSAKYNVQTDKNKARVQKYEDFQSFKNEVQSDPNSSILDVMDVSRWQKSIDTASNKMYKDMNIVVDKLGNLKTLVDDKRKTVLWWDKFAPIEWLIANKNPRDTKAQAIKAELQGLVPKVARGIFGEVWVLTDTDIKNYIQTLPNIKQTASVQDIIMLSMLDTIKSWLDNWIRQDAATYNMAGMKWWYTKLSQTVQELKDRVIGGDTTSSATDWWIDRLWVDNSLQSSQTAQTVRQKLFGK